MRHYVEESQQAQAQALAELGVCIAEDVLGADLFGPLWQPQSQRTLCIQLPGAADQNNHLAAALARVPWEMTRPAIGQPSLGERNLLVRVVHNMQAPASQPLALDEREVLRVLFVFAEARGSQPLGARQERLALMRMLQTEVYPQRRVVAHFLSHGVTRQRLEAQVSENGGYHLVHWSGHGHLNLLELARPGGERDHLSGDELLALFHQAGGFLPQLVFLSACHSGGIARVQDWNDFIAVARGQEPARPEAGQRESARIDEQATRQLGLAEQPGFTGTAHALLRGGVPSVVAMRFAVGDDYARELSVEFYRALLAHPQPNNAAAALTLARRALFTSSQHSSPQQGAARFAVCDHATPLLYGAEEAGLAQLQTLLQGSSPALDPHNRRLPPVAELSSAGHAHFVGRTWPLAELRASFIGSRRHPGAKPVAVVLGLGGMGKTALLAEALALWEQQFEGVLLFQAKPNALSFETLLREVDSGQVYPVWFGTNRKSLSTGTGFGAERHHHTTLGRADVHVPEAHRFGETGSSLWQKLLRRDLRDDRLRIQHLQQQLPHSIFYSEIQAALQAASDAGETSQALVFLHGFNVSFEEAAIRAAQIGCDLKVPGATAFFSWPSRGSVTAYPADKATIEASERAITDFLVDFRTHCGAQKLHLVAHSMGNRGLLRALARMSENAQARSPARFSQIILAAPDVDRDLFLDLARVFPQHAERTTLYASGADRPVHTSATLHDAPRAGYYTPYTVAPGIDTVAVPDFDIDLLGHSYFAQAEALLHDMHDLMRHGQAPAQRQRLAPDVHEGQSFWKLRRCSGEPSEH